MIMYTYLNTSSRIRFTLDASTSIGPGETKQSSIYREHPCLEIIAEDEVDDPIVVGPPGPEGPQGPEGPEGPRGQRGLPGNDGADGLSAYEIAQDYGFEGTEEEWLNSLKGTSKVTSAIMADDKNLTIGSSLTPAVLSSPTILEGTAFELSSAGRVLVKEDCLATVTVCATLNSWESGSLNEANAVYRIVIRRIRDGKDRIVVDYRGYIKYTSNTGIASTGDLVQLKTGDVIYAQVSCNENRSGSLSLSLVTH